jgi:hypothetical protein
MYHLRGVIQDNDPKKPIAKEPFPKPREEATIYFHQGRPMTLYCACLVKVISRDGNILEVHGVNVATETVNESKPHKFNLLDTEKVWSCRPSSNWQHVDQDKDYMVLLIDEKYVDDEPTLKSAKAEDGGKWPRSSGDKMNKMLNELHIFRARLVELRGMLDEKGQQSLDLLFGAYLKNT